MKKEKMEKIATLSYQEKQINKLIWMRTKRLQ